MSTLSEDLFAAGHRHHDALLTVLVALEDAQKSHPDDSYPLSASKLQAGAWEFLKAYGRRDHRGVIDEDIDPPLTPWVPSPAQLAAFRAGLPIPPDDDAEAQS